MHHDARADFGGALIDRAANSRHYAAGLVPGDHRAADFAEAKGSGFSRRAIEPQIAAAHAGRLDLDDNVMRPRRGIGELHQLQFAIAQERDAAHGR